MTAADPPVGYSMSWPELFDVAYRRAGDCGTKTAAVARDLAAAGHLVWAARLWAALEDLGEAHNALAEFLSDPSLGDEDGTVQWPLKFRAVMQRLADLSDDEIVQHVRRAAPEVPAPLF